MVRSIFATALLTVAFLQPSHAQQPTSLCQPGAPGGQFESCSTLGRLGGVTSSAVESSHVFKTTAGTVSGFQVNNTNAASRWVMVFSASAAPSNGAKTGCGTTSQTSGCVAKWYQVAGNSTLAVSWSPGPPLLLANGIVVACSSTGPFTLTLAADCTFSGETN